MTKPPHPILPRVAIREVHLEQLERGLDDLQGYERALIVFRLRGTIVGQAQLPVIIACTPLIGMDDRPSDGGTAKQAPPSHDLLCVHAVSQPCQGRKEGDRAYRCP